MRHHDARGPRGFLLSAAAHGLLVLWLLGGSGGGQLDFPAGGSVELLVPIEISPYLVALEQGRSGGEARGGGGGGGRSPLPENRGRPPRFSLWQLTPPAPIFRADNPLLAVEPTLKGSPEIQLAQADLSVLGNPLAGVGPLSAGPGSNGGYGSGDGGGMGDHSGPGLGPGSGGGCCGGIYRLGDPGVSAPQLIYQVEPEYSDQARRTRYQGTILLSIEIRPDGRAHNIRVLRGLGMGLDENAVAAVRQWRFRPAYKDGKPVTVAGTVEVTFRLL